MQYFFTAVYLIQPTSDIPTDYAELKTLESTKRYEM